MKNHRLAFLLSAIPGLGHFYMNIRVKAAFYALGSFGSLFVGIVLALISYEDEMLIIGLAIGGLIWLISVIDLVVTLLSPSAKSVNANNDGVHPEEEHNSAIQAQNERFKTIVLSFVPGLGHFQLGLMNRGLTLLLSFFGSFALIVFVTFVTRQEGFLIFLGILPVIWLYGLFDGAHLVYRKQKGETLEDRTVLEDLDRYRETGKKSTVLANLLAVVPGAGHLYLGLQRRGIQLMGAFLFSLYFLDQLQFTLLLFFIPLIWFYSFFDALQLVAKYRRGEQLEDIPVATWLVHHQKWVGVGLIALGLFFFVDRIVIGMLEQSLGWNLRYYFDRYVQTFIVSILLILGGIKLMTASGKKQQHVEVQQSDEKEKME